LRRRRAALVGRAGHRGAHRFGPRLRLTPADAAAGLRLGYFCGNLHWKADFRDGAVEIVMDGPEETYRARLRDAEALCAFSVERLEPEP
jgi:urease accessory protein UreE